MTQNVVAAGGRLTDWISLGVLAASVPRDAVDEAVAVTGTQAQRSGGKLPPHVMVYFAMAMALFAEDDYEEIAVRLSETLASWGCWDEQWAPPSSGGITQARARLGVEPVKALFEAVAVPVAEELTRGAWLGSWRLMAIDGFEWDAPDTKANVAGFGYGGSAEHATPFPKVRVVTISECASHAVVAAAMAGTATGEQVLARELWPRLEPGWLLIADRNFLNWADWHAASASGAELLWRLKSNHRLPVLEVLPDGSYRSILINPAIHNQKTRAPVDRRGAPWRTARSRTSRRGPGRGVHRGRPGRLVGAGNDPADHHHHRPGRRTGIPARGGLPPAVGTRDRQQPAQNPPARARPRPAV